MSDNGFGSNVRTWIEGVELEDQARQQIVNISNLPFVKGVAVMPDAHWGIGATVGSVVATKKAVIPAAVGVDIGCGMIAQKTSLTAKDLPDSLSKLRSNIEESVPHGGPGITGSWRQNNGMVPKAVQYVFHDFLADSLEEIIKKHPKVHRENSVISQLGTMGGGNHFLELCLDELDNIWIMLHSGSRGIGNLIGRYFIEKAKKVMEKFHIRLIDKDLAYLPDKTEDYDDYIQAVEWCQNYARINRELMLENTLITMKKSGLLPQFTCKEQAINCHHNYVETENHSGENYLITRKGAVRARKGDLGIIPGSMGTKSFIVEGKGHGGSFHSCSHGAGRRMSRKKAKQMFTVEDHKKATNGVECRKDESVLDETPGAYKDIDAVMNAQKDLVTIKHTLKQFLCIKG